MIKVNYLGLEDKDDGDGWMPRAMGSSLFPQADEIQSAPTVDPLLWQKLQGRAIGWTTELAWQEADFATMKQEQEFLDKMLVDEQEFLRRMSEIVPSLLLPTDREGEREKRRMRIQMNREKALTQQSRR